MKEFCQLEIGMTDATSVPRQASNTCVVMCGRCHVTIATACEIQLWTQSPHKSPHTNLDFKVVHRKHGKGLDDLEVLDDRFTAGQVLHHPVVPHHLTLTAGGKGLNE